MEEEKTGNGEQETEAPEEAVEEAPQADESAGETPRESADGAAAVEPGEPGEVLHPKERRKRERSRNRGEAGPSLSPEERVAARAERRRTNAAERRRYRKGRGAARHQAGTGTPPAEHEPGRQKVRQGTVISSAADKTITVRIESARRHPSYEKIVRRSKALHAHDERNEAGAGDIVRLVETRPMSKTKRWRLVEILERAK